MSVDYVNGDLLNSDCNAILHGANCFHTMGAGIAGKIARKWPRALNVDKSRTEKGDLFKLGTFSVSYTEDPLIFNVYTQYHMGPNAEYSALRDGISRVDSFLHTYYYNEFVKGNKTVGMPWMGCGIGRLRRSSIRKVIDEILTDSPIRYRVFTFKK